MWKWRSGSTGSGAAVRKSQLFNARGKKLLAEYPPVTPPPRYSSTLSSTGDQTAGVARVKTSASNVSLNHHRLGVVSPSSGDNIGSINRSASGCGFYATSAGAPQQSASLVGTSAKFAEPAAAPVVTKPAAPSFFQRLFQR